MALFLDHMSCAQAVTLIPQNTANLEFQVKNNTD